MQDQCWNDRARIRAALFCRHKNLNKIIMYEQKTLHKNEKILQAPRVDHLNYRNERGHLSFPIGMVADTHDDGEDRKGTQLTRRRRGKACTERPKPRR